eukprot:TRINITY_DN3630_c0_g1_i1.p1 TRINITY_DN3630_c0_g1~~TRINITY_DN3630_c0_g1_i1.p1  ORF type:complete len:390 (-),score=82.81 TRINITY_DN3630_c0_g1_i1:103-1272(-)
MDSPSSVQRIIDEEIDTTPDEFEEIVEKVQPSQCKFGMLKESVINWVNSRRFGPSEPSHITLTVKDDLVCLLGVPYYSPGFDFKDPFNHTLAHGYLYKHKLNVYFPKEMNLESVVKGELSFKSFEECIKFLELSGVDFKEKLPVLVHTHGGGWIRGDRNLPFYGAPFMGTHYAKKGYLSITVSYRLASLENRHPTQVEDLSRAIRWIYDHCQSLGGDRDKFFLSGHSAGAHLVSLVSLQPKYLSAVGLSTDCIKGVIAISGIYNLPKVFGGAWKDSLFQKFYVIPSFGTDLEVWMEASPLHHVKTRQGGEEFEGEKALPPFILFNAFSDIGLEHGGFEFFQKLQSSGVKVTHHIIPFTTHKSVSQNINTVELAVQFVSKRLQELAQTEH